MSLQSPKQVHLRSLKFVLLFCFCAIVSCKREKVTVERQPEDSKARFLAVLESTKKKLMLTSFKTEDVKQRALARSVTSGDDEYEIYHYATTQPIYYYPGPNGLTSDQYVTLNSIANFGDLTTFVGTVGGTIQTTPSETKIGITINIPSQGMIDELSPLVLAAKEYLYDKGLTEQDIQDMLTAEGGTPQDLIVFVKSLTEVETLNIPQVVEDSTIVKVVYEPLGEVTQAAQEITGQEVLNCAAKAVGADMIFSLGTSMAKSWTVAAIKKAFKSVAQRFLGPIGVAIAVVEFGYCLYQAY